MSRLTIVPIAAERLTAEKNRMIVGTHHLLLYNLQACNTLKDEFDRTQGSLRQLTSSAGKRLLSSFVDLTHFVGIPRLSSPSECKSISDVSLRFLEHRMGYIERYKLTLVIAN
jgi:hypothetical protein